MSSEPDLDAACRFAQEAARGVGSYLREGFGLPPMYTKSASASDVVTPYDVGAEERLRAALSPFDGGIAFYGEESGYTSANGTYWLVDPIDGTGLYVRGIPMCTTMISLIVDNVPAVGVIYDFMFDRMYAARTGGGATCNGERITVSSRSLDDAYVAIEINFLEDDNNLYLVRSILDRTIPVALINCGWDFAHVASGSLDARIVKDGWGKDYDYAPGVVLVQEAGGVVRNIGSDTFQFGNHSFLAANPSVYESLTTGERALFPISR